MKKFLSILFLVTSLTVFALPAYTYAVEWWPIVPCGLNEPPPGEPRLDDSYYQDCSRCDMFRFVDNMIKLFLTVIVPAVATIFFVIAGAKILVGQGAAGTYTEAKNIFRTTIEGIVIIFGAWLIVNAFLHTLAKDNVSENWWQFTCSEDVPGSTPAPTQPAPLAISSSALGDGAQGVAYNQSLVVSGGRSPYTWAITSGSLPPGVTLNSSSGSLTGTPTSSGVYNFEFKVEDSSTPKGSLTGQGTIRVSSSTSQVVSISNVRVTDVTTTTAKVTWITDKDASSQVEYWISPNNTKKSTLDSTPKKTHSVILTGLTQNTNYALVALSSVTGFNARSSVYNFKTTTSSTPSPTPTGTCTGVVCSDSNLNICGENPNADCAINAVNRWDAQIKAAAQTTQVGSGIDTVALVKAIMSQESGGRTSETSYDGTSHGIMQMQVATAQSFRSGCTTDTITRSWLLDANNVQASICISINYMRSLIGQCGTDIKDIAAGYNGGGAGKGACGLSTSCKSCSMCGNQPTLRWECLWDGPDGEHRVCNVDRRDPTTGNLDNFNQTRKYAPKVAFCYGQFK